MRGMVKVDAKGRIVIPKSVRDALGLRANDVLRIRVVGKSIVLEPVGSVAEKYFGLVQVEKWPEDLDKFAAEAVRRWLEGGT